MKLTRNQKRLISTFVLDRMTTSIVGATRRLTKNIIGEERPEYVAEQVEIYNNTISSVKESALVTITQIIELKVKKQKND